MVRGSQVIIDRLDFDHGYRQYAGFQKLLIYDVKKKRPSKIYSVYKSWKNTTYFAEIQSCSQLLEDFYLHVIISRMRTFSGGMRVMIFRLVRNIIISYRVFFTTLEELLKKAGLFLDFTVILFQAPLQQRGCIYTRHYVTITTCNSEPALAGTTVMRHLYHHSEALLCYSTLLQRHSG